MKYPKLAIGILCFSLMQLSYGANTLEPQPVNVNKVDAVTLAKHVKGIGVKRAEALVTYRDKHGNFKSIEELEKVHGISKRFIEQNKDYLMKVIKFS